MQRPSPETLLYDLPVCDLYVDESSQTQHRFLLIGGIIVPTEKAADLGDRIEAIKADVGISKEMKWTRVSRRHLASYKRVIDLFFRAHTKPFDFHSIVVDMSKYDNGKFNEGNRETGFNKELYQVIQKFRRNYDGVLFNVYPDYRESSQPPERTQGILNAGASKLGDRRYLPFRRFHLRNSKKTPQLQLCDLLLGGLAFRVNGHHLAATASPAKSDLSAHILESAKIEDPMRDTSKRGKFTIWHRQLK